MSIIFAGGGGGEGGGMLYLNGFWHFAVSFAIFWRAGLSKQPGVSVIFALFVLERFTPDLSVDLNFSTTLISTVSDRMPAVFVSQKCLSKELQCFKKFFLFYLYS